MRERQHSFRVSPGVCLEQQLFMEVGWQQTLWAGSYYFGFQWQMKALFSVCTWDRLKPFDLFCAADNSRIALLSPAIMVWRTTTGWVPIRVMQGLGLGLKANITKMYRHTKNRGTTYDVYGTQFENRNNQIVRTKKRKGWGGRRDTQLTVFMGLGFEAKEWKITNKIICRR